MGGLLMGSRGPSRHSSTSRSGSPGGGYSGSRNRVERPRYHQPTGYRSSFGGESRRYYGRRHDYIFFPVAWTDPDTGANYESGYYDENGVRYSSVAIEQDGKYDNVVCLCPYCGNESILTISASEPGEKSLACPVCGGTMEIRSALDDYLSEGASDVSREGAFDVSRGTEAAQPPKKGAPVVLIGVLIAVIALIISSAYSLLGRDSPNIDSALLESDDGGEIDELVSYMDKDTLYLVQTGDNTYAVSDSASDKTLSWDASSDSYYDADTDCWVWYNMDVEPAVWQYWYEGISSDYGDCGWMEHYDDGWFIEADYGEWIPLPDTYDVNRLWYIE